MMNKGCGVCERRTLYLLHPLRCIDRVDYIDRSITNNGFQTAFKANLPDTLTMLVPPGQLAQLKGPEILLSSEAVARMQQGFAQMGAQGHVLFNQLMSAIRTSLASDIGNVFFLSTAITTLAPVTWFFIREIPLRKSHAPAPVVAE